MLLFNLLLCAAVCRSVQQIAAAGMQQYPRWLVYMKKHQKLSRVPEFQVSESIYTNTTCG